MRAKFRRFGLRGGEGDARERILRLVVNGHAVRRFEAVFHVPDLAGNIAHRASLRPRD
jgi:hypothetical protein